MGQKTNPYIFRLGKIKEWESKYIEKKTTELSKYTFKDLEIRKFIYKFFEQNGLIVNSYKSSFSNNVLYIFVSYFITTKALFLINKINKQQKIKTKIKKKSKKFKFKQNNLNKKIYNYKTYNRKFLNKSIYKTTNPKLFYNTTNTLYKHYYLNSTFQRLSSTNSFKNYLNIKKYENIKHINNNLFIKKIFESIDLFTNKKLNIILNLKQINRDSNVIQTFSKKKKKLISSSLIKLRKFNKNDFFKNGLNLLYNFIKNPNTPNLLANYISFNLKRLERPNFFLRFLKTTLKLFISQSFSKLQRIQIKIKGRFNGAPRSKNKIITIGKTIPTLTLSYNIDYQESTAYTSNGTFGVKVLTYKN